jgi:hypothetical protein
MIPEKSLLEPDVSGRERTSERNESSPHIVVLKYSSVFTVSTCRWRVNSLLHRNWPSSREIYPNDADFARTAAFCGVSVSHSFANGVKGRRMKDAGETTFDPRKTDRPAASAPLKHLAFAAPPE